jgi:methylated-DNA-protein-cysteine methyltransferase related protein
MNIQTPFAQKIYKIVKQIPEGKVYTYKQVAKMAGRPKAFRAVGNILNKIVTKTFRVIG